MEPPDRSDPVRSRFNPAPRSGEHAEHAVLPRKSKSRSRTPKSYRLCDGASAGLLLFMVVFTPWAFGTTQPWAIWTANIGGYLLGAVLVMKWVLRWQKGYIPERWGPRAEDDDLLFEGPRQPRPSKATLLLAIGTALFLVYCLISAVNARAAYLEGTRHFDYYDFIRWLPHSYDSHSTWQSFWMYLGLALSFWAARDWVLGKTARERHSLPTTSDPALFGLPPDSGASTHRSGASFLPQRLRLLLWALFLNGAVLALVSILQRLDGTEKILWLVEPRLHKTAISFFGPFAYRSNAAQYFNLLWPVCIGFWLVLRKEAKNAQLGGRRLGEGKHIVLLPCAVLMAACPIISSSRGGAFISVAMILIAMIVVYWNTRRESPAMRIGMLSLFAVMILLSLFLGWRELRLRMGTILTDQMSGRPEIYTNAVAIARDFPLFGTGPGTFGSVYQLYREPDQMWQAYVHDDWLEMRINLGWSGFGLALALLVLALGHYQWARSGITAPFPFVFMVWVALAGCLIHAKFDFPFQIYSLVFLFVLLCAVLTATAKKERSSET